MCDVCILSRGLWISRGTGWAGEENRTPISPRVVKAIQLPLAILPLLGRTPDIAMVAAGCLDVAYGLDAKIWDIAAGVLLVSEAGGVVTAVDGGPLDLSTGRFVATSTQDLHRELVGILDESVSGR